MKAFRWGRVIVGGLLTEITPIVALVIGVAIYSMTAGAGKTPEELQAFAEWLGFIIGPVVGAIATFLFAWWVCLKVEQGFILHGVAVGLVTTVLGVTTLIATQAEFHIVFVISYAWRILAGALGGFFAQRRAGQNAPDPGGG